MIEPAIITLNGALLCGTSAPMSLHSFTPWTLWPKLMPRIHTIQNRTNSDLLSLRVFDRVPIFSPEANPSFTYWACMEVLGHNEGFEHLEFQGGRYAVFHYKGRSTDPSIWRYIYGTWIPSSPWELDDRPHFERLGAAYKNDDPVSEEHIYIPIRARR
ncbi:MAG: hypothetical protein RLZZ599_293 [Bacteroidota bacterium]